jgi:hypothetical protein
MIWIAAALATCVGAYFLFRDTLNKLQYIKTFRLYWIIRDDYPPHTPIVSRGNMYQTGPPWWQGTGVQVRVGKYLFQVGVLLRRGNSLLDQLGGRYLEDSPKELREWNNAKKDKDDVDSTASH